MKRRKSIEWNSSSNENEKKEVSENEISMQIAIIENKRRKKSNEEN